MPRIYIPGYPDNLILFQATILSGATKSEMVATQGYANDLQQAYDNGGSPENSVAAASKPIVLPSSDALFFPYIQLLSVDTTDEVTPVAQGADRTLFLLFRKYLS